MHFLATILFNKHNDMALEADKTHQQPKGKDFNKTIRRALSSINFMTFLQNE